MKFNDLYQKTIKYYPTDIDISDGEFIEETNGFRFDNLSNAWDLAEPYAENEWEELLIWIIFRALHRKAKLLYETKEPKLMIVEAAINLTDLQEMYLEALQVEGYEDMLAEFLKQNPAF